MVIRKRTMKVFNKKKFADLIQKSGLHQTEIAAALDISPKQIGAWKKGEDEPRAETLVLLARYFHVSVDFMLDLSEEPMGHLSPGEKGLTEDQRTFLRFFDTGDLNSAVRMIMEKLNKQKGKRRGK